MSNQPALDLTSLRNAIAALEGAVNLVGDTAWFGQQSAVVQDTLIAGVIHTFEFVYEIGVKMIKRQIEREAASPTEVDGLSFRDLPRIAGEKGLIPDVEAWFRYRKMRNVTAHTYDRIKAREVYRDTAAFAADAALLLSRLEARLV